MKRQACALLLIGLHLFPSFAFGYAVPLEDLFETSDDYWTTSTRKKPTLIQGGKINSSPYITIPGTSTMGILGMATGATSLGGLAFYQHTGKDPATALIDGIEHVFQPAWIAFRDNFVSPESFPAAAAQYVGIEAALGAKLADLADFIKDSASSAYSSFKDLLGNHTTHGTYPADSVQPGNVFKLSDGSNIQIGAWIRYTGMAPGYLDSLTGPRFHYGSAGTCVVTGPTSLICGPNGKYNNTWMDRFDEYAAFSTTAPPTFPEPTDDIDIPGLAEALNNNEDPQVQQDMADAIKNMPPSQVQVADAMPQPVTTAQALEHPAISTQALEQFFAENAAAVANLATEVANNPNATAQEIQAAQIAANAAAQTAEQAEAQMEPKPETYADVPLSGFEDPYSPGEFDIPLRFAQFLGNVRNSGLFSLPSSFFNSLPGGGSPVYEIEAGQYGHHSIDLSQTLSTGLAVLKTVLLACFGFLAIRAVVMKR